MSNPIIRECDHYLILEPGEKEKFLNSNETKLWLQGWLRELKELPKDLQEQCTIELAAEHLLDTACDLEIKPGLTLQWFAIRLDPPGASE